MAFKALYTNHVDMIFRFLMQFRNERDLVADWTQQCFIKAFQNLHRFEGKSKFSTWLTRIAINEMKMTMRSWKETEEFDATMVDSENHDEIEIDDMSGVRSCINRLEENQRAVFLLYEVEGYSHKEIAEMLDIGESSSRTTLTRAKSKLRHLLNSLES